MNPTSIVELGVAEAYAIFQRLGAVDLPPLAAIENEDWGRDWLLAHFEAMPAAELATLGLTRDDGWDQPETVQP